MLSILSNKSVSLRCLKDLHLPTIDCFIKLTLLPYHSKLLTSWSQHQTANAYLMKQSLSQLVLREGDRVVGAVVAET